MSRIYWDSMLFIYLLEDNRDYFPQVERLLQTIQLRGDELTTSVFTLGEVLTGPRKRGANDIVKTIRNHFLSGRILLLPFDEQTADHYSVIRSSFKLTQADAIHLATASLAQVDLFVTNDRRILKLKIPGINFIGDLEGRVYSHPSI